MKTTLEKICGGMFRPTLRPVMRAVLSEFGAVLGEKSMGGRAWRDFSARRAVSRARAEIPSEFSTKILSEFREYRVRFKAVHKWFCRIRIFVSVYLY